MADGDKPVINPAYEEDLKRMQDPVLRDAMRWLIAEGKVVDSGKRRNGAIVWTPTSSAGYISGARRKIVTPQGLS
jgi:hypothetical protein